MCDKMHPSEMDVNPQSVDTNLTESENRQDRERTPPVDEKPIDTRMRDWTKDEIFQLLQTIKRFGSKNISEIADNIPTKTEEQIKNAIDHYKERALQHCHALPKRKAWTTRKNPRPPVPLCEWAKLLQDTLSFKDLHTETATALRIIADFETFPPAHQTEKIDFQSVYQSIANAMEGKTILDNPAMAAVFQTCLVDTAMNSRVTMRAGALLNVIEYIDMNDKDISVLPRPSEDAELTTLRHLASQKSYNPLGITEQNLRL